MTIRNTRTLVLTAALLLAVLQACGGGGAEVASPEGAASTPTPTASAADGTASGPATPASDPLIRRTAYGLVQGKADSSQTVYQWLGIPYAKPPVGDLRWKAPVEPDAWTTTRSAQAFGASCPQAGRLFSPSPSTGTYDLSVRDGIGKPTGSEDCLTLNIWRPAKATGKLPVLVFIHGGSNVVGYTADPMYNGANMATKTNAVVVTLNYRLGMFGWFGLNELKTGDPETDSANFGTLDHIRALKFIQGSIAAFDGDPNNVTIMGESAGAVNVWALMVSPLAKNLFHKAISMSGGLSVKTPSDSQDYAKKVLRALLIADGKATDNATADVYLATQTAPQIAAYVRSKSAHEMIRVAVANALPDAPAVLTDNYVIPYAPNSSLASGNYNKVPMLAGNTLEEGKLFGGLVGAYKPTDYDRFTMMYNFDPNGPQVYTDADFINATFLPVDQPGTGWNDVSYALTTGVFTSLSISSMNSIIAQQPDSAWYFQFQWRNEPPPFRNVYGAVHAMDLPFWFGNFGRTIYSFAFNEQNKPGRDKLSDLMMKTIATFAATGKPYHEALGTASWPVWPAGTVFDATNQDAVISVTDVVTP